ncbi:hypothetical protein IW261DRAFT_1575174 [Armillaria novae-zelandiae]|uniref:Ty3 transposon capsid-like protein domain-containing protein n=1 Tax=Armillaria novae-zelandiae TaxID=153914 RepID=A0AA39TS90_9AGAR|nr:hypothetical protein IW261DRAFT_1575174 [Armillaria novae-zelandiae]
MSDPLENLASSAPADTYAALAPILTTLTQRLTENELSPPATSATTTTNIHPQSLCVDLPKFHGTLKESVWAFLSIIQDHLKASHIPKDDWGVSVSALLQDGAQIWYLSRKWANRDCPLAWDELVKELKMQYDSPTHANKICGTLHRIQYRGRVLDYILHFQNLEMQLDDKEMSFDDCRHYFTWPLPPDLGFHISNLNPCTMAEVYDITYNWACHKRFAQSSHKTDHMVNNATPTKIWLYHLSPSHPPQHLPPCPPQCLYPWTLTASNLRTGSSVRIVPIEDQRLSPAAIGVYGHREMDYGLKAEESEDNSYWAKPS